MFVLVVRQASPGGVHESPHAPAQRVPAGWCASVEVALCFLQPLYLQVVLSLLGP
jgi:hypothetical protein